MPVVSCYQPSLRDQLLPEDSQSSFITFSI